MTTVLIVEDDPKIRANLLFQLREEGLAPTAVESAEGALARLAGGAPPDLLLVDVRLPGISGVELLRRLADDGRLPPTVVISGEASIRETVEALQLGVHDFIEKPFSKERLLRSLRNTLEHTALRREVAALRSELATPEILGRSPAIEELRQRIARAAPTDARVLIRGESGSGKELVADALHRGSGRRDGPFIKLNCAAIPAQLIEDELFGHARGAFTDAKGDKRGLFEEADGGTLFLDEIGDMDYRLQARLLRVLEDGRVRRVGEARDREVDVRVLAATHADLEAAIAAGGFREDLYFRLALLPIEVPPLRQRPGDVRLLFEHFFERARRRHHARPRQVDAAVIERLEAHPWPGNVRELKSLCERLVVFGSDPITVDQLPAAYRGAASAAGGREGGGGDGPAGVATEGDAGELLRLAPAHPVVPLRDFRARAEKAYIESVLRRTGWNVAAAARLLGLGRTYLHQKLNDLGARRPGGEDESL